jgi:hypothetical protein
MNALELLEMNSNHVVYAYQPDGRGETGEVEFVFSDGEARVLRRAPDDVGGRYAFKACSKVKECVYENNLPIKFVQAWY